MKQLNLFNDSPTHSCSELDLNYFDQFSWAIPPAFQDPLSQCRFEEGDMLYNTAKGYLSPWSEALKHLKYCIQVTFPPRAVRKENNVESDSIFERNWVGRVEFDLFTYENKKIKEKKHIKTTQGSLYSFLLENNFETIAPNNNSKLPIVAKSLKWLLRKLSCHLSARNLQGEYPQYIKIEKTEEKHLTIFSTDTISLKWYLESILDKILEIKTNNHAYECIIFAHDKSNSLLNDKFKKFKTNIDKINLDYKLLFYRPKDLIKTNKNIFLPTLQLAFFLCLKEDDKETLREIAKKLFYNPSKERQANKDSFRIESHGLHIKSTKV